MGPLDIRLTSLSFDDWVKHVFDHEVRDPQWYFDLEAPIWSAPASLSIEHMTRLFLDPMPALAGFDDGQLNQGFWYLVSNGGSDHMFALTDASVALEARLGCLESFVTLFERLFAVRCSGHLSHRSPPGASPLNGACYMWWDIIPFFGNPDDATHRDVDAMALSVMDRTLALDSLACRESALHGLGHWHARYPTRVEEIIDDALDRARAWPPELIAYAGMARTGCVL